MSFIGIDFIVYLPISECMYSQLYAALLRFDCMNLSTPVLNLIYLAVIG